MHKTQLLIPNTLHLFFFPPLSSAELSAHAQPPWKTTCVSPLCSLQCQGGEMRTLTENTAAQKCAQLRAGPGDSFTSPTTPEPVSQHNGLEGEYGKLWHTLHVMGNALRCLESRAAERLNWEHNNTETWFQSFLSRLLSHIGFERWSRSWCAPPWLWVSIWTRWTQISATMTGRFFLAHRAQQRRCQHHHPPLLHLSSPLVTSARIRRGGRVVAPARLFACAFTRISSNKSLLIFQQQGSVGYWNMNGEIVVIWPQ